MAELPRYQITTAAYMSPGPGARVQYLEAGREIVYEGRPAYYMEPLNHAARIAFEKLSEVDKEDPQVLAVQRLATQRFDADKSPGVIPG